MIDNNTSFAAERTLVSDRNGEDLWLVAVKGTFVIKNDGRLEIAEKQEDVLLAPKHRGDASTTSLVYESDLDYTKLTTDVLLHGYAYGPRGRRTTQVDVIMKVGSLEKRLRVFGDRYWNKGLIGLKLTKPEPFEKMGLIYERAFGGVDQISKNPKKHGWEPRNPVGTGFAMESEHLVNKMAPNVEDPKNLISSWKDRPQPAGFGPVARNWLPRVNFAGTYDEYWQKSRFPLLPDDFDERFFQCAPQDQQAQSYFLGDEPVELYNLTPDGVLRFRLPRIALGFRTWLGGQVIHHEARMYTVILEPDIPRVVIVWHTMLPCHGKRFSLESTSIVQKKCVSKG